MCPLRLIPKIFLFDEEELPPELRARRTLNRSRIPDIAGYLIQNPEDYVFSSLTASIDGPVEFKPMDETDLGQNVGRLVVPMTARFVINDGQHRRAAIEEAIKERPELADETISVVFFIDRDLERSQQLFADLNKHAVRPTKSLGIYYDRRDPLANLCRRLINKVDLFKGLTEIEKTTISNRSTKLFTLSSIYQATEELLKKKRKSPEVSPAEEKLTAAYWTALGNIIPEWRLAKAKKTATTELRRDYIHAHGIALHVLGIVGADLLAQYPEAWSQRLQVLATVAPYTFEFRQELLRRLLQAQQRARELSGDPTFKLIQDDELYAIRRIWRSEENDWRDVLPQIYEEETGQTLDWTTVPTIGGRSLA